jgi:hypothetical protein
VIIVVIRVNMATSVRIAKGMQPMTEWNGMAVFFTKKTHSNELAIPDIIPMVMAPRATLSVLIWLLMPQVIEGFDGIMLDMEGDGLVVR